MNVNRRGFLGGVLALGALGGCKTLFPGLNPDLRFGVLSDIHVTTPESTKLFRKALAYFRRRGVDAVLVAGDLTDWGLKSNLISVKEAWDAEMSGSGIVPLFCTGNHDFDGWNYGDMTIDMHTMGFSESERIVKFGMKETWEEVFGEPWAPIRKRTVKGYDFISSEYKSNGAFPQWMSEHGAELKGDKPFFYFQHVPIFTDKGQPHPNWEFGIDRALKAYPNCLAFTGHVHHPFSVESNIRQLDFTEVSIPSLSYASVLGGYENGRCKRDPQHSTLAMPILPERFDLRGGQGYIVSVFGSELVVERRDFEEDVEGAEDWLVPLPLGRTRPYDLKAQAARLPVPQFPAEAVLQTETRNSVLRNGSWCIVLKCDFPTAVDENGGHAFDYEIRAVPRDGSQPMVKRFLSPAYAKLPKYDPEIQTFWFDVAELPQDREYVLEVYARNYFGACSRPIVSSVRRGQPGGTKAKV